MTPRGPGVRRAVAGGSLLALVLLLWPRAAGAAAAGGLRIVSQPGVEVTWEGVVLGETDETGALDIGGIPPGTYSVSLVKEGYEKLAVPLVVRAGTTTISLRLKRLPPPPPPPASAVRAEPRPLPATPPTDPAPAAAAPEPEPPAAAAPADPGAPPTSAPRAEDRPVTPRDASRPTGPLALALLLLGAGATALWLLVRTRAAAARRRSRRADRDRQTAGEQAHRTAGQPTESTDSRALLEDLQRREMALDGSQPPGRLNERGEVIEVREFKVIEDDS